MVTSWRFKSSHPHHDLRGESELSGFAPFVAICMSKSVTTTSVDGCVKDSQFEALGRPPMLVDGSLESSLPHGEGRNRRSGQTQAEDRLVGFAWRTRAANQNRSGSPHSMGRSHVRSATHVARRNSRRSTAGHMRTTRPACAVRKDAPVMWQQDSRTLQVSATRSLTFGRSGVSLRASNGAGFSRAASLHPRQVQPKRINHNGEGPRQECFRH
jgi:hypothetical protein